MACYTVTQIELEDDQYMRKARANLGLPETGLVTEEQARRIRKEAGVVKTQMIMRRLNPGAVIRRQGDKLFIQAQIG